GGHGAFDRPGWRYDGAGERFVPARVVVVLSGRLPEGLGRLQRLVEIVFTQTPGRQGIAAFLSGTELVDVVSSDQAREEAIGHAPSSQAVEVGRDGVV